jgi:integrase
MARKANGQGHTYKVGNSYRTVIRCGDHTITAMAATAQDSRKKAKLKLESMPNILAKRSALPSARLTVGEFLLNWLEEEHKHNIAHSTYKRYRALLVHHVVPIIGELELQKINPSDISKVISSMREAGQSPRSQQQARALVSVGLGEAENKGYIALNPVKKVRVPINKGREIEPLGIEEVKRLLETYKGTFMSARLHIALLCGLRQGEALGLRWQDIDLDNGLIEVRSQVQKIDGKLQLTGLKTDRSKRCIALTLESIGSLKNHKLLVEEMRRVSGINWVENDLVFPASDGNFCAAITDYSDWKRAIRLCGIKPRRLHDARHTAATLMYSQGVGIEVISRALGHSSSAITSKLYVHSAIKPQVEAANRMSEALFSI